MAETFSEINERLAAFIGKQHMFFVATAPSGDGGHVNLSPKGLDSFRVLGPTTVAYLDL
ncbi:MAG: pyridoxamine 5'-phosphate oxidase family protein, partial [Dehalococcoidia bacterium]